MRAFFVTLKRQIRTRKSKTDESYTAARAQILRERDALLGRDAPVQGPTRAEAVVLKVNQQSARMRMLGEEGQVMFRSSDVLDVVPGHLPTLCIEKRWTWRGDPYASGAVESAHLDIAKLGLEPLPLDGGILDDVASYSEPCRRPDPYAPLWRKLAAKPRPSYEFDGIAWGALPGLDAEENPTCDAAELAGAGDTGGTALSCAEYPSPTASIPHIDYPGGHKPGAPLFNNMSSGPDWRLCPIRIRLLRLALRKGGRRFDLYYDDIVLSTSRVGCLPPGCQPRCPVYTAQQRPETPASVPIGQQELVFGSTELVIASTELVIESPELVIASPELVFGRSRCLCT